MFLVVGLGNYEKQYDFTYHNVGFMVADNLAEKCGATFSKEKCYAKIAETNIYGEKVIIAKPLTYMNRSGLSIREFVSKFKIPLENLIVIYDDIDLDKGCLRTKKEGSAGTHNGMRSVVEELNSTNFARVRIGTKNENKNIPLIDYVVSKIDKESFERISPCIERATAFILEYIQNQGNVQNINY